MKITKNKNSNDNFLLTTKKGVTNSISSKNEISSPVLTEENIKNKAEDCLNKMSKISISTALDKNYLTEIKRSRLYSHSLLLNGRNYSSVREVSIFDYSNSSSVERRMKVSKFSSSFLENSSTLNKKKTENKSKLLNYSEAFFNKKSSISFRGSSNNNTFQKTPEYFNSNYENYENYVETDNSNTKINFINVKIQNQDLKNENKSSQLNYANEDSELILNDARLQTEQSEFHHGIYLDKKIVNQLNCDNEDSQEYGDIDEFVLGEKNLKDDLKFYERNTKLEILNKKIRYKNFSMFQEYNRVINKYILSNQIIQSSDKNYLNSILTQDLQLLKKLEKVINNAINNQITDNCIFDREKIKLKNEFIKETEKIFEKKDFKYENISEEKLKLQTQIESLKKNLKKTLSFLKKILLKMIYIMKLNILFDFNLNETDLSSSAFLYELNNLIKAKISLNKILSETNQKQQNSEEFSIIEELKEFNLEETSKYNFEIPNQYQLNEFKVLREEINKNNTITRYYQESIIENISKNSKITIFPDGYSITYYSNKDKMLVLPGGNTTLYYHKNKSLKFNVPSKGYVAYKFKNNQFEKHFFDGRKHIRFSNGCITILRPNGEELNQLSDKSLQIKDKNGKVITIN